MNPIWITISLSAAGLSLALLVHAVNLSFKYGETSRDVELLKRMSGLANGADAIFQRADIAKQESARLSSELDQVSKQIEKVVTQLVEIKVLLAGRRVEE